MTGAMTNGAAALPRIWFDVEDLFHFASRNARPTGIQRVCFEIYCAAAADPAMAPRIGFLRHATAERGFIEVGWTELETLFRAVTTRPADQTAARSEPPADASELPDIADDAAVATAAAAASVVAVEPAGIADRQRPLPIRLLKRALGRMPERIRRPTILFTVMQAQAAMALAGTAGLTVAAGVRHGGGRLRRMRPLQRMLPPSIKRDLPAAPVRRLADIARRGDILVVLGSPWFELEYAELAAFVRGRLGMRVAVLLHDVIPVRRPEWVDRGTSRVYRDWYTSVLPLADVVFANSQATANDVASWCRRDNVTLHGAVTALPVGTGFGLPITLPDAAGPPEALPASLATGLKGRPYVLFVSTVEARKNHMLLFRVWRRLLEEMAPDRVPDLVFVGKVGWMVSDLMSQIENSRNLGGRLHVIEGLDDAELRSVYAGCLFTVFPSFYEGWGLPVSESMAMGKPCISSNATSLPEAGGTLARYFDPVDLNDATRVIRATIEDRAGLALWQEQVRRSFRPVPWTETADALLRRLDA